MFTGLTQAALPMLETARHPPHMDIIILAAYLATGAILVYRGIPAMVDEAADRSFGRLFLACMIAVVLWPGEMLDG